MSSDVTNAACQFAELERCNAILTEDNTELKAYTPEGWIPPAAVLEQLKQQADKHTVQIEALGTEQATRIKSLEAQVEELEVGLGKYKRAVEDMANIT